MSDRYIMQPYCLQRWSLLGHFFLLWLLFCGSFGAFAQKNPVRAIYINGLEKTHKGVILREMTFDVGDSIAAADIDSLLIVNRQNIYNIGLFNKVDFEIGENIASDSLLSGYIATITVKERWYIFPAPYAASEERTTYDFIENMKAGNVPRISYGGVLTWRNMFGNNETLNLFAQTGFSQRFYVDFVRPAILPRQRIDMAAGVSYIRKKSTMFATENAVVQWARLDAEPVQRYVGAYIWLRKRFSPRANAYLRLSYRHFQVADSLRRMPHGDVFLSPSDGAEYYPSVIVGFETDQRDIRTYPLKGYRFHAVARYAGWGLGTTNFGKFGFTWSQYFPLSRRWNLAYGTQFLHTIGTKMPFIEKNFLGVETGEFQNFAEISRGYEPYTISGSTLNMTKVEMRFAALPRRIVHWKWIPLRKFRDFPLGVYLTTFYDAAYVSDRTFSNYDMYFKNQLLGGYGVGLNFISIYDILARVELSRNIQGRTGLYFSAKVAIP